MQTAVKTRSARGVALVMQNSAHAVVAWMTMLCVITGTGCVKDGPPEVVLWHSYSGAERDALEATARDLAQADPDLHLRLVAVPHDAFVDKITAAVPNGNGPDLFIYAHDRLGDWIAAGMLEPVEFFVDESMADRFDTQALTALAERGSLWGLPLAVKTVALFYRTDLVPTPPATTDELLAIARGLTDRDAGRFGLIYENTVLYFHGPWLHGFGARVFADNGDLAVDSPPAIAALKFALALGGKDGVVPPETTGVLVGTLFNEGKAAMAISGPWFVGGMGKDVPWKVTSLPVISATGRPAAPFLGTEALLLSARAKDKAAAFRVMERLTSDASATRRALEGGQVVPNRKVYEDPRVAADPVLSAFRAQATVAIPMPSRPEMRAVWTPYQNALQRVLAQGEAPDIALKKAQDEIKSYIVKGVP